MNQQHESTCLWRELKFLPLNALRERSMTHTLHVCDVSENCLPHMGKLVHKLLTLHGHVLTQRGERNWRL